MRRSNQDRQHQRKSSQNSWSRKPDARLFTRLVTLGEGQEDIRARRCADRCFEARIKKQWRPPLTISRRFTRRLLPPVLGRRDQRFDKRPFCVNQITRITQLVAIVANAVFLRPQRRHLLESGRYGIPEDVFNQQWAYSSFERSTSASSKRSINLPWFFLA
jgi:hypothetical protein